MKPKENVIQLYIELVDSNPKIWRRIWITSDTSFFELHHIIQIAMGWENYHLFDFNTGHSCIEIPNNDMEDLDDGKFKSLDAFIVEAGEIFIKEANQVIYTYDLGDDWKHSITAEKFLPLNSRIEYPVCIEGELACPPEDCGGIPGYYNVVKVLADKKHPEHKEIKQWLNRTFRPDYFDIEAVNEDLAVLDDYITEWLLEE